MTVGSVGSEERQRCPVRVRIIAEKPKATFWEIAAARVVIDNHHQMKVASTFVVTLSKEGRQIHRREGSVDIAPGEVTYDLATALGFVPLIRPNDDVLGEWRVSVTVWSEDCLSRDEAVFRVERPEGKSVVQKRGLVPSVALPAVVTVRVDPSVRIGNIDPLIYGVNVEGNDPFVLPKELRLGSVRWPGGCFAEGYHWRSAIGPVQERRARGAAVCEGDQMSSRSVQAEVGSDEFMAILQRAKTVPLLTVNFATGSAQEAANWVEYMNGTSPGLPEGIRRRWTPETYSRSDKAPPGYFAWLREHFGRPQPYGVKYWAIGNEFEARSTPSWTRDSRKYYIGGTGRIRSFMTRDSTRTDWSLNQQISTGQRSAEFFAPFVPAVAGSQKVEALPVLRVNPLELGSSIIWAAIPNISEAGQDNVYQFIPGEGRIVFGDGVHGNVLPRDSVVRITYDSGPHDGFIEFARRMKAVDPTILLGTSAAFSEIPTTIVGEVDFVAANLYPSLIRNDSDPVKRYYRIQAAPGADYEPYLRRAHEYLRQNSPMRKIQLAVTEYNFSLSSPHFRSLASAIFVADILRVFAVQKVSMAHYYSLDHLRHPDARDREVSPPAMVFRLYRDHFGTKLIAAKAVGVPSFVGEFDGRQVQFPYLEVLASQDDDGQKLYLMVINKHAELPFPLAVRVAAKQERLRGRLFQLWAEHPFDEKATLTTRDIQGSAGIVRLLVPPHSVNVLELTGTESGRVQGDSFSLPATATNG